MKDLENSKIELRNFFLTENSKFYKICTNKNLPLYSNTSAHTEGVEGPTKTRKGQLIKEEEEEDRYASW